MTLEQSVPSFAAGTALWSAALLLTGVPREFAAWIRLISIAGAVLFAIVAARIFWGEQLLPISSPLPFFAYPFLVLTFAGWIWTLLKSDRLPKLPKCSAHRTDRTDSARPSAFPWCTFQLPTCYIY